MKRSSRPAAEGSKYATVGGVLRMPIYPFYTKWLPRLKLLEFHVY